MLSQVAKAFESRNLTRADIQGIWQIDRSEIVEAVYVLVGGRLSLRSERHEPRGWPDGVPERSTPAFESNFDRGGWFYGLFDGPTMVGVAILESRFMGQRGDMLQLLFLHVSYQVRDRGYGRQLFMEAAKNAKQRGARSMYVSATPSEHTVDFYLGLGCIVSTFPDPELYEREPEDIHLEYTL